MTPWICGSIWQSLSVEATENRINAWMLKSKNSDEVRVKMKYLYRGHIFRVLAGTVLLFQIVSLENLYSQSGNGDPKLQDNVKMLREGDVNERQRAAIALGASGNSNAVEPLIEALEDEDDFVRNFVVRALGSIGDARALEPLVKATEDPNLLVRRSAVAALGNLGNPEAFDPLIKAFNDGHFMVRRSAAAALGSLGDPRAIDSLIEALGDKDTYINDAAVSGLTQIGEAAIPNLVSALGNWFMAHAAAEVLENLDWAPSSDQEKIRFQVATRNTQALLDNWETAKRILINDAGSEESPVVHNAVLALIGIGKDEVIGDLVAILNEKGNSDMARIFVQSGNDSLAQAAKSWAAQNGLKDIEPAEESVLIQWGEMSISLVAEDIGNSM